MIAAKFGGTSMGSAVAIKQVAEIMGGMQGPRAAIVSATSGTTDKLIALGEAALKGGDFESGLAEIISRHDAIIAELAVSVDLSVFWEQIRKLVQGINLLGELSISARDHLIGFGERMSVHLLAAVLNKNGVRAQACDAYNFIFTDNNFSEANVNFEKTYRMVREVVGPLLAEGVLPVITGFVAQAENGLYSTLGRGGSDYTGAIIGAALDASEVQIWTDVDGILNTDPRLVPEAKVLSQVSFNEAGELAYFGAKVLHPKTIKPAIEKNIPVKILNTFNVSAPGTLITNEEEKSLKAVTYKKGISIINVCSAGMLEARGFMAKLFEVFARHEISVDVVSTSEVSVSLTVEASVSDEVLVELKGFAKVDVTEGMAIVCLVGGGIISNRQVLGELFTATAEHDVSMVSQGASKRNITFLVKAEEAPVVVKKIFNKFFK
ncbi:MAG: aspartate kinase [Patescibacteria group bacterium]